MGGRRDESGAAIVDFVLVTVVLIPVFLGILQVALVAHIRNTLASAAASGALYAAPVGRTEADGVSETRREIASALSPRFAQQVSSRMAVVAGVPVVEVTVVATIPALGLGGPSITVTVHGHATRETFR